MSVFHDCGTFEWHDAGVRQHHARVDFVCADKRHLQVGRDVPDGKGHLTVVGRQWAYCSAALEDEPHDWRGAGGLDFAAIRHSELGRLRSE
jgi:hypothetical protein